MYAVVLYSDILFSLFVKFIKFGIIISTLRKSRGVRQMTGNTDDCVKRVNKESEDRVDRRSPKIIMKNYATLPSAECEAISLTCFRKIEKKKTACCMVPLVNLRKERCSKLTRMDTTSEMFQEEINIYGSKTY